MLGLKIRKMARWTAVAVAVLCCAAWAFGGWWELRLSGTVRWRTTWLRLDSGLVEVGSIEHVNGSPPWQTRFDVTSLWQLHRPVMSWRWWFDRSDWTNRASFLGTSVLIPLWAPFAAAAGVFAGLAWYDRRRPWQCRACRYDLSGNTTGRCPECGAGPS